ITLTIIGICMGLIVVYSGFHHEDVRFKTILITLVIVLIFQFIIGDPIKFVVFSIDEAFWPKTIVQPKPDVNHKEYTRVDILRMELQRMRSNFLITEEFRNQNLNIKYKYIAQDLWIYGIYFVLLMCMVMVSTDETLYYNTHTIRRLIMENHTDYYGLKEIYHISQLFDFIESTLVSAFEPNTTSTGMTGWVHCNQTNLLGVVRLRQLRIVDEHYGWEPPQFSEMSYMPDWQLPYRRLFYTDKYWRIYEPFLPISASYDLIDMLLLNFNHIGFFNDYPELKGYIALLARTRQNSIKIMDYLTEYHWLNYNTCAVFMDFTLYNVDANVFSVCTLRVEQTPFGGLLQHVDVESVKMLDSVDQKSYWNLLVLLLYVVMVIIFSKSLVLRLWYDSGVLNSMWNKVDLVIFVLNVTVFTLIVVREWLVSSMLKKVEGASKMEFIDFRRPSRLHQLTTIMVGFLICITTLRLWRVLLFASVFKLFTRTLYLAWQAVFSTAMVIIVFLIGFCLAVVIINGNNSANFNRFVKSVVTCVCFSFGFSGHVNPSDMFMGGKWLGIVLYGILAFVIAVLLINVFVSLINDYFTTAKLLRDAKSDIRINFLQFLRVEYARFFNIFRNLPCFRKKYRSHNRTVTENINRKLAERSKGVQKTSQVLLRQKQLNQIDEDKVNLQYRTRGEKLMKLRAIINKQIELLDVYIFGEEQDAEYGDPSKETQ
ncbi:polycystin-2-like protein 1, partial [Drosophila tropicalis]|uniref:polycystin-2-like protein 1 n=1 Tax=Drosophila tropicalis TaxID=46794 RepID=UPI0035ABBA90